MTLSDKTLSQSWHFSPPRSLNPVNSHHNRSTNKQEIHYQLSDVTNTAPTQDALLFHTANRTVQLTNFSAESHQFYKHQHLDPDEMLPCVVPCTGGSTNKSIFISCSYMDNVWWMGCSVGSRMVLLCTIHSHIYLQSTFSQQTPTSIPETSSILVWSWLL